MSDLILTEEELQEIFNDLYSSLDVVECMRLRKMVASHKLLLSANAELSFKNQKFGNSLKAIAESSTEIAYSLKLQAFLTLEELK